MTRVEQLDGGLWGVVDATNNNLVSTHYNRIQAEEESKYLNWITR